MITRMMSKAPPKHHLVCLLTDDLLFPLLLQAQLPTNLFKMIKLIIIILFVIIMIIILIFLQTQLPTNLLNMQKLLTIIISILIILLQTELAIKLFKILKLL